jgi:hypothetical protein
MKYTITVSTDESGARYFSPLKVGETNNKREADKIAKFYDGRATITEKNPAAAANGAKGGRTVKGYIKNQCTGCGKIHFLKPSEGTFGRWYGACPECGAEYLGQGRPTETPTDVKISCMKLGR